MTTWLSSFFSPLVITRAGDRQLFETSEREQQWRNLFGRMQRHRPAATAAAAAAAGQ